MATLAAARKTPSKLYQMMESEEESDDELLHFTVFSQERTKAAKKKKKDAAEIAAETTEKPPPTPLTSQEIEAKGTSQVCQTLLCSLHLFSHVSYRSLSFDFSAT
jgi:DNA polymerase sigma